MHNIPMLFLFSRCIFTTQLIILISFIECAIQVPLNAEWTNDLSEAFDIAPYAIYIDVIYNASRTVFTDEMLVCWVWLACVCYYTIDLQTLSVIAIKCGQSDTI